MVIGRRFLLLVLLMLSLLNVTAIAAEDETDCLVYFYGTDCAECAKVSNYLQQLKTRHPKLQVQEYEVYYNRENNHMLEKYFDSYNLPLDSRGLPVLFLSGSYFIGSSAALQLLEGRILDNSNEACPAAEGGEAVGVVGAKEPYQILNKLTLGTITRSALEDAFRPGLLAFILVFMLMLSCLRKAENVLERGVLSIATLAVTSIMFALGLFFQAPSWVSKIVGVLAIITSLIRIRGFFGLWKIVIEGVSEASQQKIITAVRYLFTPIGFVMVSFIMALLSTGKTSKTILLLRMLALDGVYDFKLIAYILYHTVIIVVLPVIIVFILYRVVQRLDKHAKKKEPFNDSKAELWRGHTQKVLQFAVSSLMLIIGFILLLM